MEGKGRGKRRGGIGNNGEMQVALFVMSKTRRATFTVANDVAGGWMLLHLVREDRDLEMVKRPAVVKVMAPIYRKRNLIGGCALRRESRRSQPQNKRSVLVLFTTCFREPNSPKGHLRL